MGDLPQRWQHLWAENRAKINVRNCKDCQELRAKIIKGKKMCSPNIRCLACSPTSNHLTATQHWVIERSAAKTRVYQTGSWPEDMGKIRCLHLHQEYGGERDVFPQLRKLRFWQGSCVMGGVALVPTPTTLALLIRYSRDNANHTPKEALCVHSCNLVALTAWNCLLCSNPMRSKLFEALFSF